MNTRLPDLLHDLASEMPTETRTPAHRTLRRARTRRAAVATFASVAVVAVVLGTIGGLRALAPSDPSGRPVVPATGAPTTPPSPDFQGLWPETDAEALAEMQAQVDAGHMPLRADPEGTASLLAINVLGWEPGDERTTVVKRGSPDTIVELRNTTFAEDMPPITVVLGQLGRAGENGVWSVLHLSSPLITGLVVDTGPDGTVDFSGAFGDVRDTFALRFEVLAGPNAVTTAGGPIALDGSGFDGSWIVQADDPTPLVLWIHVVDAGTVATVGAAAMPVGSGAAPMPSPTEPATPTETPSPDFTDLPPDVAVTAQRIYDAILAGDVDALAPLLDPNTFAYNFDDGSDPIPGWREDPSDLDLAAAILQLPPAEPRQIEGYGTFYIWPYLIDSDFSALTEQERADLHFLGYSDEEIQLMIDGGYGYQGARLGIDTDGLWRNFTTMGE